jgi:hypothetical protein
MATADIIGTDFSWLREASSLRKVVNNNNNSSAGKPVVCDRFREDRTYRPNTTLSTWLII